MLDRFMDYTAIQGILADTPLPPMFRVRQVFPRDKIQDVAAHVRMKLQLSQAQNTIKPGMRVAVTAGSRGIANIATVLKEVVAFLRQCGAHPFLVPAMGSHGGATAQGQAELLHSYGVTEAYCRCPIVSSMETVQLGVVEENGKQLPVYIDRAAAEADGIVVVNRIKPHSAFRGPVESGLTKMLCVGLGKQKGADTIHGDGFGTFKTRISLFGEFVRTHTRVLFGVGLIENAYDETSRIEVLFSDEIPIKEGELLRYAGGLMPSILIPETDVLVVKEIGKNFSGSGMDPNISGTWSTPYGSGGIKKQRTCVLDLTDMSHGNGLGIGQADTTTLRFLRKMDFLATYPNALTSTVFLPVKLPMVLRDDRMAIQGAVKTCNGIDTSQVRIVFIRNTLWIEEIYLSQALWEQAKNTPGIEILEEPHSLPFDDEGNLLIWQEEQA